MYAMLTTAVGRHMVNCTPQHSVRWPQQFAGAHLYNLVHYSYMMIQIERCSESEVSYPC